MIDAYGYFDIENCNKFSYFTSGYTLEIPPKISKGVNTVLSVNALITELLISDSSCYFPCR